MEDVLSTYEEVPIAADSPPVTMDPVALGLVMQGIEQCCTAELIRP